MKKMLSLLLSTAAMFGAASKDATKMMPMQCGAFDISLPTGPGGEVDGWAWKVNRFDAQEATGRKAGWIVAAAQGEGDTADNTCMSLVTNMPNNASNPVEYGVGTPGDILQRSIVKLNQQFSDKSLTDANGINPYVISSLAVLMKYGNTLLRAYGKRALDQSNWVPDVQCEEADFPADGNVCFAIEGDKQTPVIEWVRERAMPADGAIEIGNPLVTFLKNLLS